jgi:hypothetical protein
MDKLKIIGCTGLKFNGKDSIANHLCEEFGYQRVAFADPLKEACGILFGFSYEQLHGSLKETPDPRWFGLTPRQVFQFFGTDLIRKHMRELDERFGEDFWLLCAMNKINAILSQNKKVVISDVRFPNECELIKKMGGTVIRVTRPQINTSVDLHESEVLIIDLDVDMDVKNDGTLEDLHCLINQMMNSIQPSSPIRPSGPIRPSSPDQPSSPHLSND